MMKKSSKTNLYISLLLWIAFIIYTVSVKFIDVATIGNKLSPVGFSSLNQVFFDLFSKVKYDGPSADFKFREINYNISEILGYVAILVAVFFVFVGFVQLIKYKNFKQIDKNIYALGGFYAVVMFFYALFEVVVVNYRPLLDANTGELEASYPSSHTILTLCILTSALIVLRYIFKNLSKTLYIITSVVFFAVMVITVATRLMSGVHWFTDILGGVLLSIALLMSFKTVIDKINK